MVTFCRLEIVSKQSFEPAKPPAIARSSAPSCSTIRWFDWANNGRVGQVPLGTTTSEEVLRARWRSAVQSLGLEQCTTIGDEVEWVVVVVVMVLVVVRVVVVVAV